MKHVLTIIFLFIGAGFLEAQTDSRVTMRMRPHYLENTLVLHDTTFQAPMEALSIDILKFYISQVSLLADDQPVWNEEASYHLIDASDTSTYDVLLNVPENIAYDEISFLLGIDSITSVSGVFGGDLDPINGMYWAWNSGYINFKIEGKSESSPTRDKAYQFHLGGYAAPFANAQKIQLPLNSKTKIEIKLDLENFLNQIDLSETNQIMSPSQKALELSELLSTLFYIDE